MKRVLPLLLVSFFLGSCGNRTQPSGTAKNPALLAEKPGVDSSRVLPELDLYRAKRFESVQEAAAEPDRVHKLVLYGRDLQKMPSGLSQFTYLSSLDVSQNQLSSLGGEISSLHYLQGLYAVGNRLTTFPEGVVLLPVLQKIDLSNNQISSIPESIQRMDQLVRLSMDDNAVTRFPVALFSLKNLSVLELARNGLTEIPEGIASLKKLKKLDLAGNQITSLPKDLGSLRESLEELNLQGNPIPREEIDRLLEALPATNIRF
ncbi:MAG: leucine-rich repeat domain-containing protein [Bacteroidales bacterium]